MAASMQLVIYFLLWCLHGGLMSWGKHMLVMCHTFVIKWFYVGHLSLTYYWVGMAMDRGRAEVGISILPPSKISTSIPALGLIWTSIPTSTGTSLPPSPPPTPPPPPPLLPPSALVQAQASFFLFRTKETNNAKQEKNKKKRTKVSRILIVSWSPLGSKMK